MSLAVFQTAVEDFKKSSVLTQKEENDFKLTNLDELRQVIFKLQREQENRRSMMYMKRLDPFLTSMEKYGKVIEAFLNTTDLLAFIWVS